MIRTNAAICCENALGKSENSFAAEGTIIALREGLYGFA
jgi:hypothetical protein